MIIYRVTSPSGKCYVGKTIRSLRERKLDHISTANNNNNKLYNTKFCRAIRKYGNNLVWEEIGFAESEEQLNKLEIEMIKTHDSFKNGYNLTLGGEGVSGRVVSDETKRKLSIAIKGTKRNFSEEHRRRIGESKRGDNSPMRNKEVAMKVSLANRGHENNSKTFKIFLPDGSVEIIKNLNKYCRNNGLSAGNMIEVANGTRKHHKGYTIERVNK